MSKLNFLNIGCGDRFHEDWVNIDVVSKSKSVKEYDITKGIPFKKDTFDVVYHSHVIEHIPFDEVKGFVSDCYRILKPGGIIRIALPDLENITKKYLETLSQVSKNNTSENKSKYNWMKLELLDQMVRNHSGGKMKQYLLDTSEEKDVEFIQNRVGAEATKILDRESKEKDSVGTLIRKFLSRSFKTQSRILFELFRDKFLFKILLWGKSRKSYEIGNFRTSGEIHQWMYDRYSIQELLKNCGFKEIQIYDAFSSNISNWNSYELDSKNGVIHKPDSLFVEAVK